MLIRSRPLAEACALYASIFALLYVISDPRAAVGVLFVAPVALSALAAGPRGGLLGALAATALLAIWGLTDDAHLTAVGWASRPVAYFIVGAMVGRFEQRTRERERERQDERYAIELSDRVVQSLVVARYALEGAEDVPPAVREALDSALTAARDIVSSRLAGAGPGDLRLTAAPPTGAPPRARRSP